jgi:hypothetical protein
MPNDYRLFATYESGQHRGQLFWQQPMNTLEVISNLEAWSRAPDATAMIDPGHPTHIYLRHLFPELDAAWVIEAPSELAAAVLLNFWNEEQAK